MAALAIHQRSARKEGVRRDQLRAIPEALLESELFGHEKGSFTVPHATQRPHRNGLEGTLFLDEIGELPLQLQVKLLLFSRNKPSSGWRKDSHPNRYSRHPATNVDLKNAMTEGKFREDLYYRLAVIPSACSIAERPADILVWLMHSCASAWG